MTCPLVLVVDDDVMTRKLAQEMLGQNGFAVAEAESGKQALSICENIRPDIVLLDVVMPEMDGFETCAALRCLQEGEYIPVLMVTSLEDLDSIAQAYEVGATDFISKPINWLILQQRIHYILRASQAIDDLRRSEAKNRALLSAIPDMMFCTDQEGRLLEFKAGMDHMPRASPEGMLGKHVSDILPAGIAEQVMWYIQFALQGEGIQLFEYTLGPVEDGRHYEACISANGPDEVVALVRDITERKRGEQQLRKLSRAVEQSPSSIMITDISGNIEYVNPKFCRVTGYGREEVMGRNPRLLKSGKTSPEEYRRLWQTITSGGEWRGELHNVKKNGELFWESASISAIRDSNGIITHFLAVKEDITERKRLESQLVHAQKMESIGQLAAGIAHEINTPTQYVGDNLRFLLEAFEDLQKMLDAYEVLLPESCEQALRSEVSAKLRDLSEELDLKYLSEEIPQAIDQSLQGAEQVARIVRAMKQFSHPDTPEKTATNLNAAIESTVTVARNEWKYVADMILDLDSELPLVSCLSGDLNQAILNIIVNAAHAIGDKLGATPQHKGKITVTTQVNGNWAEIRIADTGGGIPEKLRSRVFDPFFTTKEVGKGTGQGLAIAYSVIVDKHDGTIHFETKQGEGTTFIIRLPRGAA